MVDIEMSDDSVIILHTKSAKCEKKMKNDEEIKPTLRINIIIVISFLQSFMWKFYDTIINNIVLTFPSSCKIYKIRKKKIDVIHYIE